MVIYSIILLFVFIEGNSVMGTDTFLNFQQKYSRVYESKSELSLREDIFNQTLAKIEEHNKKYEQGLVSYKLGVNQFADLTSTELAALLTLSPLDDTVIQQMKKYNSMEVKLKEIPTSVNWTEENIVTPAKSQGTCGSGWTFTTTGTVESRLALKSGTLVSLSEQQLLDCNSGNYGCDGGDISNALEYVEKHGLTTEDEYPYKGIQLDCNSSKPVAAYVKGYTIIANGSETDLMTAVGLGGPVAVALNNILLYYYSSGIFNASDCPNEVNHAGLVVGYDSNANNPYWIIKNSWGESWGENGYFRMAMGEKLCGITTQPIYPTKVSNTPIGDDDDGVDNGDDDEDDDRDDDGDDDGDDHGDNDGHNDASDGSPVYIKQHSMSCLLVLFICFAWNLF